MRSDKKFDVGSKKKIDSVEQFGEKRKMDSSLRLKVNSEQGCWVE